MLTALKAEDNELLGFDAAVTDYVTKPFSIDVLMRRIENQLSINYSHADSNHAGIVDGDLLIDLERYSIYVCGQEILILISKTYVEKLIMIV